MKKAFQTSFVILFLLLNALGASERSSAKTSGKIKPYMSQNFIDTMIQNAFYSFVEASEISSRAQMQAIDHAKLISQVLRDYARTDPNRSYINFRVGELDYQIFLEEEEIRMKREYERQKAINVLVEQFNIEVGKWRPTFLNLIVIYECMEDLNRNKAEELYGIVSRRLQNISRELVSLMDIALANKEYKKVQKEFEYLRENRKYLKIASQKYGSYEDKIFAINSADSLTQHVDVYINDVTNYIKKNNYYEALRHIEDLNFKLGKAQQFITPSVYTSCKSKIYTSAEQISKKEDSLVNENMQLVSAGNSDAAIEYLERVLRAYGISNDKIQKVDKAIMRLPSQQKDSRAEEKVEKDISTFADPHQGSTRFYMDNVRARAQQKADSIRQSNGGSVQGTVYGSTIPDPEPGRDNLSTGRESYDEQNKKKAEYYCERIYELLDNKEVEKAYKKFRELRSPLQKYLSKNDFSKLESATMSAYNATALQSMASEKATTSKEADKKKMEDYVLSLITEIYSYLDKNNIVAAQQSFKKNQHMIKEFASKDAYEVLESSIEQAYALKR